FRPVDGSPPTRCSTTSVVRLRAPTLEIPATKRPSQRTRNLKFLYGSKRRGFTLNSAIVVAPQSLRLTLTRDLLDRNDDELGGLERCEAHQHVDDAEVDVRLRGRRGIALHEVGLTRGGALKRPLSEEVVHEGADRQPNLRPERLVV